VAYDPALTSFIIVGVVGGVAVVMSGPRLNQPRAGARDGRLDRARGVRLSP
jgi:hypothetical protein